MKKIKLTRNKFALVDDDDYYALSQFNWHAKPDRNTFYAARRDTDNGRVTTTTMHREIILVPDGYVIDHINGNGLDNRKSNLRICTIAQNCHNKGLAKNNTTGHKGVSRTRHGTYMARIVLNGKSFCLGSFRTKEEASTVYNRKAEELYGEYNWNADSKLDKEDKRQRGND